MSSVIRGDEDRKQMEVVDRKEIFCIYRLPKQKIDPTRLNAAANLRTRSSIEIVFQTI